MMKAIDVISTGRSRTRQASRIACTRFSPSCSRCLRELDDQDRVLAGQPRQHEEADLREDVVVAAGQPHAGDRAEQRHRHDQDHDQRQRPALVLRRQHHVDEQHAQREDEHHRVAGEDLLVGQLGPLERHAVAAAAAPSTSRDRVLRLARAEAGRRAAVDLGGREAVVVHHLIGTVARAAPCTSDPSGTIAPLALRVFEPADLFRLQPEAPTRPAR